MKIRAVIVALAIAPLIWGCAGKAHDTQSVGKSAPAAPTVAVAGKPAPDWNEPTAQGPTLSLASLRGKAVYLNFFASWCPPCNEEAPDINALQAQFGPSGLQVVGVDVLENAAKARQFVSDHHLTYPAVVDSGTLRDQYRINGLPVHVFIDRSGVIRRIIVGELSKTQMTDAVRAILRQAQDDKT